MKLRTRKKEALTRAVEPLCMALAGVCILGGAIIFGGAFTSGATLTALGAPEDAAYRASVEKWRQNYETSLKADDGWLSVAGLFWLHEGENRFGSDPLNDIVLPAPAPANAGSFTMHDGHIV